MKMSPEEIERVSHSSPSEIATILTRLLERIDQLEQEVAELKRQLVQTSQNSSKPPSSDNFRKPTNLRKPGGKKGAPKGHPGQTLHAVDCPDAVVIHPVTVCSHCWASLDDEPSQGHEARQVFDLPPPRIRLTEHRT